MKKRTARLAVVFLLLGGALAASVVVGWDWVSDYLDYVRITRSLPGSGESESGSLGEFLRYREGLALYDAAENLETRRATAEEVKELLGKPDHINEVPGRISWFYPGPLLRNQRQPTIVVQINPNTSRVMAVRYIVIN